MIEKSQAQLMRKAFLNAQGDKKNWESGLYDYYDCLPTDLKYVYCNSFNAVQSTTTAPDNLSASFVALFNHFLNSDIINTQRLNFHLQRAKTNIKSLEIDLQPVYQRVLDLIESGKLSTFTLLVQTYEQGDRCELSSMQNEDDWEELVTDLKKGKIDQTFLPEVFNDAFGRAAKNTQLHEVTKRANSFVIKGQNYESGNVFSNPYTPGIVASLDSSNGGLSQFFHSRTQKPNQTHLPTADTQDWLTKSQTLIRERMSRQLEQ